MKTNLEKIDIPSATEASKITEENKDHDLKLELRHIAQSIYNSAEKGSNRSYIFKIQQSTIKQLEELGYNVHYDLTTYENPIYVISW